MTALVWDKVGERVYQTGVDRGVLYLHDGTAVAWNGLTSVEETSNLELKVFYQDGVKFLENLLAGDFTGKLKAFTYPDEFDAVNGLAEVIPGLFYHDQPPGSFNLSYRTRIGNDLDGVDHGYKIHILYNIKASPDGSSFQTLQDSIQPVEFSWTLTGTPPKIGKYRPTSHVSIDSRKTDPNILQALEDKLYGTNVAGPSIPSMAEIAEYFGYIGALIIVDHGDGSWSAIDQSDKYINLVETTTFIIDNADVTYLAADTYEISSTNVGGTI